MRCRTKGQSLVEMALLLPLMLVVIFGIIDFGWYVYSYATVYMAARNGAEKATMLPPMMSRVGSGLDMSDSNCVGSIVNAIGKSAPLFDDLATPANISIRYPSGTRDTGEPIEVTVRYTVTPLTPLWNLIPFSDNNGEIVVSATTRRSIEVLGNNPNQRYAPNLTACN